MISWQIERMRVTLMASYGLAAFAALLGFVECSVQLLWSRKSWTSEESDRRHVLF
jgi:hypothetical protein